MKYNRRNSQQTARWVALAILGGGFFVGGFAFADPSMKIAAFGFGLIAGVIGWLRLRQIQTFRHVELSSNRLVIGLSQGEHVFNLPEDLVRMHKFEERTPRIALELSTREYRYRLDSALIENEEAFTSELLSILEKTK